MKGNIVALLLGISCLAATLVKAQGFDKKDISVCFYDVTISSELGIIPDRTIDDSIYNAITKILKDSADINLNSIDYLKDKIPYIFGYPVGTARKAAKSKMSHSYVKIIVDIQPAGVFSTSSSSSMVGAGIGSEKKKIKARVKVAINLEIYNDNGDKVKDVVAKVSSKNKIEIDTKSLEIGSFSIMNLDKNDDNFDSFQDLISAAAIKIVNELKQ